jgi:broad specificity phosphatase PhoE
VTLFLVRHGRPLVDPDRPPASWTLDPAGYDEVWALRTSGRLPARAAWFCSPETKAIETAQLLTDARVGIVDDLREQERSWVDDLAATLRRAVAVPDRAAHPGWETVEACRARLLAAVVPLMSAHGDEDMVLVGHGTAWTLLAAALNGGEPDLDRWAALAFPDVIRIGAPGASVHLA